MSLFNKSEFEKFAGAQPGVTFHDQWESRVAKVGDKVFTLLNAGHDGKGAIVFKTPQESFEILTAIDGIKQAPYFAKRQWVQVSSDAELPEHDLKTYILRSYRTVAAGLTKKLRSELDITVDLRNIKAPDG